MAVPHAASENRQHGEAGATTIEGMNTVAPTSSRPETLNVSAINPDRLDAIRAGQHDERGNALTAFAAEGWEPLRCCLAFPEPGDRISLIAYTPFGQSSPWAETGPVYIHPDPCTGYRKPGQLPDRMRTGPKILRTYRADATLDYDHITPVPDGVDLEPMIRELLALDEVATVHVRAVLSQCFAYAVSR